MNSRQLVLEVLCRTDSCSTAIAQQIGKSTRRTASALSQLYRMGVLTREAGESTGGRPPYLYSIKRSA